MALQQHPRLPEHNLMLCIFPKLLAHLKLTHSHLSLSAPQPFQMKCRDNRGIDKTMPDTGLAGNTCQVVEGCPFPTANTSRRPTPGNLGERSGALSPHAIHASLHTVPTISLR